MLSANNAKPFLKWAGGKGQLLDTIDARLPPELKQGAIHRYVEPFVGGGAVFFHIAQHYHVPEFCLSDINPELVLAYRTVQTAVSPLIQHLTTIENRFLSYNQQDREHYFYEIRDRFNEQRLAIDYTTFQDDWVQRTAWLIFLNRTCYNGLFRVNSKGEFNVPFGRYRNPRICYRERLQAISAVLQHTTIRQGHYRQWANRVNERTFVYFDPPYRPISATASFNSYSKHDFDDAAQLELAAFFRELDDVGAKLMLSNSDPKNEDPDDDFFDDAYAGFAVERVPATRQINSKGGKRGPINELLITNYGLNRF